MADNNISFNPKARIILQLGDQLIRSENIAILELIKNSYDACAKQVTIRMRNIEDPESGVIEIEDDGIGMDYNLIKDVWLTPGTTFKKNLVETREYIEHCNRVPLGEKGIGRFGAHKLGEEIELISKKQGSQETHLKIKWNDFDNDDMLDSIPIDLSKRSSVEFPDNKTGTKIIIRKLRTRWTRGGIRSLYRAINSLNSPFESDNSFRVLFKIDQAHWLDGLLSFKDIKDSALFSAEVILKDNKITKLTYRFTPWTSLKGLKERTYEVTDIEMMQKEFDEKENKKIMKDIDLSDHQIGEVKMKMLIFDLDTNILSLGGIEDKRGFKAYLKDNGGIRVYRDGVRVYDYGEPGNDWLNLDLERVNLPAARISNNIVIGAVSLNRLESTDLVEKTNREGFIENDAFRTFFSAVRFTLARIVAQRNIDKEKIRSNYSKSAKKVPVVDNLFILREKVESGLPESDVKSEILGMIAEIEDDYKTISEVYIRSASAGLSLSIVIHEIEKIIQEMLWIVEENKTTAKDSERIKSLTWHMGKLIDGYSGLIRRRSRRESDLKQVMRQALWNIEFRLNAHGVDIIKPFDQDKPFGTKVKCSDNLVIGTIINIIDNSIWWLNYGKVQNKKLWIQITDELPDHCTVIIADNGPGFTLPTEDVIKPFISNKESGIGIGLHIAHEIMNSHGGDLLFPEPEQFSIPEEFRSGAIVALAFKTSNNE
mgnify:CR=1 FL=1